MYRHVPNPFVGATVTKITQQFSFELLQKLPLNTEVWPMCIQNTVEKITVSRGTTGPFCTGPTLLVKQEAHLPKANFPKQKEYESKIHASHSLTRFLLFQVTSSYISNWLKQLHHTFVPKPISVGRQLPQPSLPILNSSSPRNTKALKVCFV